MEWLNPRRNAWHIVLLAALLMGLWLTLAEAMGEGGFGNTGRFMLVAAVYVGIEGCGVLFGFWLLGRFLGLYRSEGRGVENTGVGQSTGH